MSSLSETWSWFGADNDGELWKTLLLLFHNKPSWFIWGGRLLLISVSLHRSRRHSWWRDVSGFPAHSNGVWVLLGSKLNNSLQTAQASSSGTILSISSSSLCPCAKQTSTKEFMLVDGNTKRLFDWGCEVGFTTLWFDGFLVLSQSTLGKTKQNES